jgi:hypothetical protein
MPMLQVQALPAKGFARATGALALAISALSLGVHAFAVFGSYSDALMRIEDYLFFGLFPIMILAALAYRRLLSEFSLCRSGAAVQSEILFSTWPASSTPMRQGGSAWPRFHCWRTRLLGRYFLLDFQAR